MLKTMYLTSLKAKNEAEAQPLSAGTKMDGQMEVNDHVPHQAQPDRRSPNPRTNTRRDIRIVVNRENNVLKLIPTSHRPQLAEPRERRDELPVNEQARLLESLRLTTKLSLLPTTTDMEEGEDQTDSTTSIRTARAR